ncbi:MAG: FAD-dependent oxidoreductase [Magnetococcales bacterium]|nr:FAD-dependent oxidoreductase [Magnetococcales bacterium]
MSDCSGRILVLGGGVSGLAAAVALAEAGQRPLLLEAASQLGGRARSFREERFGGEWLDNGPHLLVGGCHQALALLQRLHGVPPLSGGGRVAYDFWDERHGWHGLRCPNWPAPWHLAAGLAVFPGLSGRDRLAALRLGLALRGGESPPAAMTVSHWLERHGQSGALVERLWGPMCLSLLNEGAGAASAALFVTVMRRLFLQERQGAAPRWPGVPLSALWGDAARAFIESRGGEVRLRCRVEHLDREGARIREVVTRCGRFPAPRRVISALPWFALERLLPDWAAPWRGLTGTPLITVHLLYGAEAGLNSEAVALPGTLSQWLVDRKRLDAGKAGLPGARLSAVLSGAWRESRWPAERLALGVHREVGRVVPALAGQTPLAVRVVREQRATFAPWPEVEAWRPGARTPWNNLLLAGDWTATGLPSTLEGAVVSGNRAAAIALG